jgi:aspartate aminotransferase
VIPAGRVTAQLERASWIRRMFEEGARLAKERGPENVFDFTLGNPEIEPPDAVVDALRRLACSSPPGSHGYMPNAGFPQVRARIAAELERNTGLPYTADHVIMTCGSAGAINTLFRSILDPGDEVIVLLPFFPEYQFYIDNHGGRMVQVQTRDDFQPDIERLKAAITPRTKAIILNSPNNPSGVIYPAGILEAIDRLDTQALIVSDEPYKPLVFDGAVVPETAKFIRRCATAFSWSKSMAISGERVGYLAFSPRIEEWDALRNACTFTNRILGFINAPAIWQRVVAEAPAASVDAGLYQRKRDIMCEGLARAGYEVNKPQGAFYVFPKSPIDDDIAFIRILLREGILAVPGSGFGRSGYFRISFTVPLDRIERSLPGFERAIAAARRLQ